MYIRSVYTSIWHGVSDACVGRLVVVMAPHHCTVLGCDVRVCVCECVLSRAALLAVLFNMAALQTGSTGGAVGQVLSSLSWVLGIETGVQVGILKHCYLYM